MNEKMSFKKGVKLAVLLYMGRIFGVYCMNVRGKSAETELQII